MKEKYSSMIKTVSFLWRVNSQKWLGLMNVMLWFLGEKDLFLGMWTKSWGGGGYSHHIMVGMCHCRVKMGGGGAGGSCENDMHWNKFSRMKGGGGGGHSHTNVLPTSVQLLKWTLIKWHFAPCLICTPKWRQTCKLQKLTLNGAF